MDNVNEALLNRPQLDGTPEDENAAAKGLRNEKAEARNGGEENAQGGIRGTIRQMINQARQAKENEMSGKPGVLAGETPPDPSKSPMARLLRYDWWPGLIATWGLTLILIHAHVFCNTSFGKKFFCDLGDEWPVKFPGKKLLERILLVLIDLIALFVVLWVFGILVLVVSFFVDGSIVDKAKKIFQAITMLGWGGVDVIFNLFK